jgi:hypothetical protein
LRRTTATFLFSGARLGTFLLAVAAALHAAAQQPPSTSEDDGAGRDDAATTMTRHTLAAALVVAGALVVASAAASPQKMNERARDFAKRYPGDVMMVPGPLSDYPRKTVAQFTREADVVFHGRLVKLRTYISEDGEQVVSDYAIRDSQLLAARSDAAYNRATDASKPRTVTLTGGELLLEGVQVRGASSALRHVVDGGEYLLFLTPKRGEVEGYTLYSAGIFAVEGGKVQPLHVQAEYLHKDAVDAPLAAVLEAIQAARIR